MIEVKDEILNGEPKYRLRDNNGNVIYDNVSVEMTTPVVEEGTPLNKALFDSIGNDFDYFDNISKLTRQYNLCTATTNITTQTTNIFPYFTPSGNLTYSSGDITLKLSNTEYIYAFDGDSSTNASMGLKEISALEFARFDFGSKTNYKITSFRITGYMSDGSATVYASGSNDGDNWTSLGNVNLDRGEESYNLTVSNPKTYRYYRFTVSQGSVNTRYLHLSTIAVNGWEKQQNNLILDGIYLNNIYQENIIVNIKIPNNITTSFHNSININSLGAKNIIGLIEPNKYCVLVYNGTDFEVVHSY